MKRLYILFAMVLVAGLGRAMGQPLQITPSDTFVYNGTLLSNTDNYEQNGYFTNNTTDTVTVNWQVVSVNMDSTWQLSFCDPENCYYYSIGLGTGNYTVNHFTEVPHGTLQLRFGVTPYCIPDSAKMVVRTWIANDSAASVQNVYFIASYTGACVSAVQNINAQPISVFPNPITSSLNVEGIEGLKNVRLKVHDILGNVVLEKFYAQPQEAASFNTSGLQTGVYFITVDSNGTRLVTRRVQKLD